jgi:antagonist of KipI
MIRKMSSPVFEVLSPGILTTVQDLGREGYLTLGIAESGAMDAFSLVAANRLLGNPDHAAGLEITVAGPKLRCLRRTLVSLTGAHLSARLNQRPLSPGTVFEVREDDLITFGGRVYGMRAYLGVSGGIDVPLVLGSRSTYVYAGFGGFKGRPLRKGDVLSAFCVRHPVEPRIEILPDEFQVPREVPERIRVILGPQEDRFTAEGLDTFLNSSYVVTPQSNRMGYRLDGPRIIHRDSPIIVSEATPLGAVQVPGQGTPVILLRERGTTGGYTKIACVITRDLDLLAQIFPGEKVRFHPVEIQEAHRLERERWERLDLILPRRTDHHASTQPGLT